MNVVDFKKFLEQNKEKIEAVTPKNPSVPKDDEWIKEKEWDKMYDELKEN